MAERSIIQTIILHEGLDRNSCGDGAQPRSAATITAARGWNDLILKRVQNRHAKLAKISFISSSNDQTMYAGSRSNHCILDQPVGFSIHNPPPFPKASNIHRQDLIRVGDLVDPVLNLVRFRRIADPRPLNTSL